jgi:hypothetical protein
MLLRKIVLKCSFLQRKKKHAFLMRLLKTNERIIFSEHTGIDPAFMYDRLYESHS